MPQLEIPHTAAAIRASADRILPLLKDERNDEITRRFIAGESLANLSAAFDLSPERIRQIVFGRVNKLLRGPTVVWYVPAEDLPDGHIGRLELNTRAANCLRNARVETITQLRLMTDKELLAIKGMGRTSLRDIHECLRDFDRQTT